MEEYVVKVFKSIGHPIRLKIIKKLGKERLCVCELQEDVEFSQANLSQHLKVLKESEILVSEKEGLKMMYKVKDERILEVITQVEEIVKSNFLKILEGR